MTLRTTIARASLAVLFATTFVVACGDDSDDGSGSGTTASGGGTATSDGGGASAGAPKFLTFEVSSSVPCEDGNATATMAYTTENVEEISIKIGDGEFATTAGYGPNETSVVAEIPCDGAGESTIQLRGCTAGDDCVDSDVADVTITA